MNFDLVVGKLLAAVAMLYLGLVGYGATWPSNDHANQTLQRSRPCLENQQYHHNGLCCLNCQAGTFVQSACERDLEQGTCVSCEHGQTYTEHSNGMTRGCLPCTHCRTDEIQTVSCTPTTDTKCQCKPGTFCVPDQACEVCKRCAKCKAGEVALKNCTPISNTVCRKQDPSPTQSTPSASPTPPDSSPVTIGIAVGFVLLFLGFIVLALLCAVRRRRLCQSLCSKSHGVPTVKIPIDESGPTAEEKQNNQNAGLEGVETQPVEFRPLLQETQAGMSKSSTPVEDEDRGLGDSLPNTTSSSQTSLSALPTATSPSSTPHESPVAHRLSTSTMEDPFLIRLVPLLGSENSMRKSFDLFDEYLDVRIHNKFFRLIGVSDNSIRIAESAPSDKVYDLLKNWMQREGLKADINTLLQALLSLDQRRSAESIACEALRRGYYKHADTP